MNLISSTSIFSFFTLISRILGYLRDILIAFFLGASIFADNVILFDLEDYLNYVRSSPNYSSKFIPALREYSKSHPDGVEISKFK